MSMVYIIASFEYSFALELAITDLLQNGINKEEIKSVPLVKESPNKNITTQCYVKTDGFSLFDLSLVLGNIFAVFFICFGFIWKWGPIIWGLIGFLIGVLIGVVVDIAKNGLQKYKRDRKDRTEIYIMIKCPSEAKKVVKEILWNHNCIGIAEI